VLSHPPASGGPAAPAVWANSLLGSRVTATAARAITATAAVTATAAAAVTATVAVTATAVIASPGAVIGSFVDRNSSSIDLVAIQSSKCCVGFRFVSKRDESESATPTSVTVFHYYGLFDGAMIRKDILQPVVGGVPRETSDVESDRHSEQNVLAELVYRVSGCMREMK
jgi:hypothetical protein